MPGLLSPSRMIVNGRLVSRFLGQPRPRSRTASLGGKRTLRPERHVPADERSEGVGRCHNPEADRFLLAVESALAEKRHRIRGKAKHQHGRENQPQYASEYPCFAHHDSIALGTKVHNGSVAAGVGGKRTLAATPRPNSTASCRISLIQSRRRPWKRRRKCNPQ